MKRRGFIAGLSATITALFEWPAKAAFGIFQVNGPSGVTFQNIDGGSTYYTSAGLTRAASAGWDSSSYMPIGVWLTTCADLGQANLAVDLGINTYIPLSGGGSRGNSSLTFVTGAGLLVFLAPYNNANTGLLSGAGAETVGINNTDEPDIWSDVTQRDVVTAWNGTNNARMTGWAGSSAAVGRIFMEGFDKRQMGGPGSMPGNWPSGSNQVALNTLLADPAGNNRHIDMTAADIYWFAMKNETAIGSNLTTGAGVYGLQDTGTLKPFTFTSQTYVTTGTSSPFTVESTGGGAGPSPNGNQFEVGAGVVVSSGVHSMTGTVATWNPATNVMTMTVSSGTSPGAVSGTQSVAVSMSHGQANRATHYGDLVDAIRPWQSTDFPAPIIQYIENGGAAGSQVLGSQYITPPEMNAAVWSSMIHGCRLPIYFNQSLAGPPNFSFSEDNFGAPYFQTLQGSNTISIYDQAKVTNALIKGLAAVLNSQYALNYVSVTGDNLGGSTQGFVLPWNSTSGSYVPGTNKAFATVSNGVGSYNFNTSLASAFEVMAKKYTGSTTGSLLVNNKFYVFAMYRGASTDTNIVANFTIMGGGATVTRIFSDAVLGAVSNGAGGVTITCGSTSQIAAGAVDTVVISGTGVSNLNGTFNILATNRTATTFDIGPLTLSQAFSFSITAATWSAGFATFTTSSAHGFPVGQSINIVGVTLAGYNSRSVAQAGTTGSTIVIPLQTNPGASSSGGTASAPGVMIALHPITVSGGTTFSDTFPNGNSVGIYRVN